jgi:SCF-associated factor 1
MGNISTNESTAPNIISELQYRSVISVALGDYHKVALTEKGKVLTWGGYQEGALGLGDPLKLEPGTPGAFANESARQYASDTSRGEPPRVETPTEVSFNHGLKKPKERFAFAIAAAGWHTGALVIDLRVILSLSFFRKRLNICQQHDDPEEEEVIEWEDEDEEIYYPRNRSRRLQPVPLPTIHHGPLGVAPPAGGIFRVGFAGRGLGRGGQGSGRGAGGPSADV